ncbi:permease [Thermococcus sp. P6]|uniref:sulfite exporter TauE/SafE family protein n=1 Tax=Thermococcus sp. P6 TaxID=122420 RepID=UPI000B59ADC2|nr:sulfite exporter TauE/SafE family protein [Thermococcus sp. P6]ASJ10766.1 permease [Thermococcus sp. P6]
MLDYLLDLIIGLGIGLIAGLFGVGGGFLIVPTLVLLGLPVHVAVGTSLVCITFSSLSAAFTHLKKKAVLYRVVLLKESFSAPFALAGAYVSSLLPEKYLRLIFAFLLLYLAVHMFRGKGEENSRAGNFEARKVALVGVLSGLTSGLLGISGGILNVPLFYSYVGIPMRYAIGTSSFALFFTALVGSIGHYSLGQVDVYTALLLSPGLLMGARLGALLTHRLHPEHLRKGFSVLLVVIAIKILM